jgi:histidinol phosphatase-like enzyme
LHAYKTENLSKVNLLSVIFSKHNLLGYFALAETNVEKKKKKIAQFLEKSGQKISKYLHRK